MQAVGHLDEHHAHVLAHGEQQLAEVLGLYRRLVAKDATRDFGEAVNDARDFLAKLRLDVLDRVVGVLDHIVQQRGADAGRAKSYLLIHNGGYGNGMHDIGLSRAPTDALMGISRKLESLVDNLHFLAVIA